MPGRSNRSARVVICDDVSWSEPAPRSRPTVVETDASAWEDRREVPRYDGGDYHDAVDHDAARRDDEYFDGDDVDDAYGEYVDAPYGGGRDVRGERGGPHGDSGGYRDERAYRAPETDRIENAFDFGDARRAAASRTASRGPQPRRGAGRLRDEASDRDEPGSRELPVQRPEAASAGYRVEDYLGEPRQDRGRLHLADSPVIEYTDVVDEDEVWGPRPKLLPAVNGGRRTVVITGHAGDGYAAARTGARDGVPAHTRHGFNADRTAMWAVLLCVIVLLVAVTSH